ncbi:MAG: amidohydrolase [Chitinophagaceae bacterium]|nr:MAG: amidohydrolase [Chitinophagaceae bacterium]
MKYILLLLSLACNFCIAQSTVENKTKEIVFDNVNLITMENDKILPGKTVVTKNGVITAVMDAGKYKPSKGAVIIDGNGKYLMPGLAEMHAHVPPIDDIEPMKDVVMLFAANGITTIRGMLGHPKHLELRAKIRSGEIVGPHFYSSGPSFNGGTVKTPAEAAARVKEQKAAGYDFLKLHPGITLENFKAVAKAAKAEKIPFAGHVSYDVGVWNAIDAEYATIDHMDGFIESLIPGIENIKENETGLFATFIGHKADTAKFQKLSAELKKHDVWVVPTQALAERWLAPGSDAETLAAAPEMKYMSTKTVENWVKTKKSLLADPHYNKDQVQQFILIRRRLLAHLNRDGVGILLGSDGPQVFNVPGFSVHHELQYLVDAGFTPYEALKTGTVNVGKFYNRPAQGFIRVGSPSDLVLLTANPLQEIRNTTTIIGVMIGTQFLDKAFIDARLQKLGKIN